MFTVSLAIVYRQLDVCLVSSSVEIAARRGWLPSWLPSEWALKKPES